MRYDGGAGEQDTEELEEKNLEEINERRFAVAETDEEHRCNEDVSDGSQRGKSLLDICRVEIVFIPQGKLKVIV